MIYVTRNIGKIGKKMIYVTRNIGKIGKKMIYVTRNIGKIGKKMIYVTKQKKKNVLENKEIKNDLYILVTMQALLIGNEYSVTFTGKLTKKFLVVFWKLGNSDVIIKSQKNAKPPEQLVTGEAF